MTVYELIDKLQDAIDCKGLNGDADVVIFDNNTSYDLNDIDTNYNDFCFISMKQASQDKNDCIIGELNMNKDIDEIVREIWGNHEFREIMDKYVSGMFFDEGSICIALNDGTETDFR